LCDALIAIRHEIRDIESGTLEPDDNPLVNAPHTAREIAGEAWAHRYSRDLAAFPAPWVREHKYWPTVGRIDNAHGDRHLVCSCPPLAELAEPEDPTAA
jgi:glycine dehydrogenase